MDIYEAIQARYSVRLYSKRQLDLDSRVALEAALASITAGPLGSELRFALIAAAPGDSSALRGLGTYGFIRDPAGFIIGSVTAGAHALEDYGYAMEQAILEATCLGLGTCWLGGTFTQSSFAARISRQEHEVIPAVTALGYPAVDARQRDSVRRRARADTRLPWQALFFDGGFSTPLDRLQAGEFVRVLDMVRIAPSASNRQPWRVVRSGDAWHFFCQRTPGYGKGSLLFTVLRLADLQRLDVGIAMCHFDLAARAAGLAGDWRAQDPGLPPMDARTLYVASWVARSRASDR